MEPWTLPHGDSPSATLPLAPDSGPALMGCWREAMRLACALGWWGQRWEGHREACGTPVKGRKPSLAALCLPGPSEGGTGVMKAHSSAPQRQAQCWALRLPVPSPPNHEDRAMAECLLHLQGRVCARWGERVLAGSRVWVWGVPPLFSFGNCCCWGCDVVNRIWGAGPCHLVR